MDARARSALEKLLTASNRSGAGVSSRAPVLTSSHLSAYQASTSLVSKEQFEATLKDARARGAIELVWDDFTQQGFIKRVTLTDIHKLAHFLGQETAEAQVALARTQLKALLEDRPVLSQVLDRWAKLKTVRGTGPLDVALWLDAARVIDFARENTLQARVDIPIRAASARLFNDSKRIEKLAAPIDVLLVGDVNSAPREAFNVWRELGLFREDQPARLAGRVVVRRHRVEAVLDAPYGGFDPTTVLGLASAPSAVLSIENQTSFHVQARSDFDKDVLLLYTAGMPSPAWRAMYAVLLRDIPRGTPVYHWGDLDEGGFRIAARISKDAAVTGHALLPWRMDPSDVPQDRRRVALLPTLRRMKQFAVEAGWAGLGQAVEDAGFTVEQEAL